MRRYVIVLCVLLSGCALVRHPQDAIFAGTIGATVGGSTAALSARYQKTEVIFVGMAIGAVVGWTILLLTKDEDEPKAKK